jgi:microcin C transport system permease protein
MSFFSPVNQARWARFRHNRRGYWSLWLFLILFLCSLGAELLANDRPLLVQYRGQLYVPVLKNYTEQTFGGAFATAADYQDPWLQHQLASHGWALWPPVRFGATTINFASTVPFPRRPRPATGSAPTPTAAMCWRGSSMGRASRCSSACC